MSEETVKIGKWDVPKALLNEYIKYRVLADDYTSKNPKVTRKGLMIDYEISLRWQACVQRVMEIHREICKVVNVPYSEEPENEFYKVFIIETDKRVRRLREGG